MRFKILTVLGLSAVLAGVPSMAAEAPSAATDVRPEREQGGIQTAMMAEEYDVVADYYGEEGKELLAKCVMAEAGGEGETGMRLVTACILNQLDDPDFPDTIQGVISLKGNFASYPYAIRKAEPTDECYEAIKKEVSNRSNYEIKFFRTDHYHGFGTPELRHGAHYFSKE